jgi:hypothetical protein
MWKKLLTGLVGGPLEKYIEYKQKKRELNHERDLEVIRGKIAYEAAKTARAEASEGRDHEPFVVLGFDALASTPEWYRWLIVMIYAAVFGIRVWRRKL